MLLRKNNVDDPSPDNTHVHKQCNFFFWRELQVQRPVFGEKNELMWITQTVGGRDVIGSNISKLQEAK